MVKRKRTLNKGAHSVYELYVHIVFQTKFRYKVIDRKMLARMHQIFSNVCSKKKSELLRFNGEPDHVHLLVSTAPSVLLSDLVCCLKSASSRILRKEFATRIDEFYRKPVFWSDSYCAVSAGGASLKKLREYIDNQDSPEDPEEEE